MRLQSIIQVIKKMKGITEKKKIEYKTKKVIKWTGNPF